MPEVNMKKWDSAMFPDMTDEQLEKIRCKLLAYVPKLKDFFDTFWLKGCTRVLVKEIETRRENFSNI